MKIRTDIRLSNLIAFLFLVAIFVFFMKFGEEEIIRQTTSNYTDQYYYRTEYETGEMPENQIGLNLLMQACKWLGMSYSGCKFLIGIICLTLVWKRLRGYHVNYFFLLLLYFFSAYISDIEQMRSFIGTSFIIYGTKYLEQSNWCWKNMIKYCILVIISASVHSSMVFYLLFLLIPIVKNKRVFDYFYFVSAAVCLVIVAIPGTLALVGNLAFMITHNERVFMWFSFSNGLSFYACIILHGIMVFMLYILRNHMTAIRYETLFQYDKEKDLADFAYYAMQVLSLAFPFYMLSAEFFRLFRCMFIFFFFAVLLISTTVDRYRETKNRLFYGLVLTAFVGMYLFVFKPHVVIIDYYQVLRSMV